MKPSYQSLPLSMNLLIRDRTKQGRAIFDLHWASCQCRRDGVAHQVDVASKQVWMVNFDLNVVFLIWFWAVDAEVQEYLLCGRRWRRVKPSKPWSYSENGLLSI